MNIEQIMNTQQLTNILAQVAADRPVFHSEADFQHQLALALSHSGYRVRLEIPLSIQGNEVGINAELDLLIIGPDQRRTAIELKYVTAQKFIVHEGESFNLKQNWGTNLSRFDSWSDFQRVGAFVAAGYADNGFAIFLTNAADAWNVDASLTANLGQQFSMHESRNVPANTILDWVGNPTIGSVSRKRLPPYSPLIVPQHAVCNWRDFSDFPGLNGRFRYLLHSL
jgi:hypothetical protein